MKLARRIVILFFVYVGIVAAFESLIGYFQPSNESTLVITTTDVNGEKNDRVLARLESDDKLYVAANHWPRAWYDQALDNPNVQVVFEGRSNDYLAIPVRGEEHDRVDAANSLGLGFRILTGFPPRYFLRLDPR